MVSCYITKPITTSFKTCCCTELPDVADSPGLVKEMQRLSNCHKCSFPARHFLVTMKTDEKMTTESTLFNL